MPIDSLLIIFRILQRHVVVSGQREAIFASGLLSRCLQGPFHSWTFKSGWGADRGLVYVQSLWGLWRVLYCLIILVLSLSAVSANVQFGNRLFRERPFEHGVVKLILIFCARVVNYSRRFIQRDLAFEFRCSFVIGDWLWDGASSFGWTHGRGRHHIDQVSRVPWKD